MTARTMDVKMSSAYKVISYMLLGASIALRMRGNFESSVVFLMASFYCNLKGDLEEIKRK